MFLVTIETKRSTMALDFESIMDARRYAAVIGGRILHIEYQEIPMSIDDEELTI